MKPPGGEEQEYLRAREVAARFGVSQRTIWYWVESGLLPHYRLGRSVFFCRKEIDRAMGRSRFVGSRPCPPPPPDSLA